MSKNETTGITSRPIRGDEDFQRVRDLLIDTHSITPPGFNWEIRRWDGWRYYNQNAGWDQNWEKLVRLWETDSGRLVGVAHPEGSGDVHLEIHPDYRSSIEEEMLIWAEKNLSQPSEGGPRELVAFCYEYDRDRHNLLKKRDYEQLDRGAIIYLMRLGSGSIPSPTIPTGYNLRETLPDNHDDAQRIADIINAAFKRTQHNAEEFLVFQKHAGCYRSELDLVIEAPDGTFASYVGLPYDEKNRYGIFEPVCTHPDHTRKGLAQALMFEALRRAKEIGAVCASTETGATMAANRLYESIGFTETYNLHVWRKSLPGAEG